ncbi:hypothetical protein EC973_003645 [Apophysomyces ossiformis]|uniref:G-patch domain-containing protein n=1 Tax=Apophysomyces ossiformis TaxID=679940 RepID=A0A8H7BMC8_9FUNG|nr:hypothetical protein EC973_003645 [Apophysomyces ossiformis]
MEPKRSQSSQLPIGLGSSQKLALHSKGKINKYNIKAKPRVFQDDDDQDDDDQDAVEMLAGFENNKSQELNPKEKDKPLMIAPTANVDWRERKKIYVPAKTEMADKGGSAIIQQEQLSYGLQITTRNEAEVTAPGLGPIDAGASTQPLSLEEEAMAEIIREASTTGEPEEKRSTLVIPANEVEAFREDVRHRPDEPTIDAYEKIPVHEFGAALLRGLGWKEGEGIGRNRKNSP